MCVIANSSSSTSNSSSTSRPQSGGIEVATKSINKTRRLWSVRGLTTFIVNNPISRKQALVCSKVLGKSGCWLFCVQCSIALYVSHGRPLNLYHIWWGCDRGGPCNTSSIDCLVAWCNTKPSKHINSALFYPH